MSNAIPDDPSVIAPLFKQLKQASVNSMPRLSVDFRVTQLQCLARGLTELKEAFAEALQADLGLSAFYN